MQQQFQFPSDTEPYQEQALLSSLLQRAKLYSTSNSYAELLQFVIRLPNFAPFNAMLLNIQKPGLRFAATARDWRDRFNRTIREGARPLVILWPFAPVAFVYDVEDTDGEPLPDSVAHAFHAAGGMTWFKVHSFELRLRKQHILLEFIEYGEGLAGHIKTDSLSIAGQSDDRTKRLYYRVRVNSRHNPNVQFGTIAHELGHLFLGHLGGDRHLKIQDRSFLDHDSKELEAESVAYIVCRRANIQLKSERYLAQHLKDGLPTDQLDVYAIMRAAGQVESALGIAIRSHVD